MSVCPLGLSISNKDNIEGDTDEVIPMLGAIPQLEVCLAEAKNNNIQFL